MRPLAIKQSGRFLGANAGWEEARVVLVGVPLDDTVSFRPGTRLAPSRIREVSESLEEYSLRLDRSLEEVGPYDAGDLELVPGSTVENLERIEGCAAWVLESGKNLAVIGGEHLLTYGVIRALIKHYPDLVVLQWDAHADLRSEYQGARFSHATVMRRVRELGVPVYQVGIRSVAPEEREPVRELRAQPVLLSQGQPVSDKKQGAIWTEDLAAPVGELVSRLKGRPVYLSLDIDVVDPGYAPGTGCPEPGGVAPREVLQAIERLQELDLVGFDLVEVNPMVDAGDCTSFLAAKLIRELLLAMA
ncbi:MAG: agmatinase [Moorellales bacterium]